MSFAEGTLDKAMLMCVSQASATEVQIKESEKGLQAALMEQDLK
jgi:hypothetical protein